MRLEAHQIMSYELVAADGSELPEFEPGSHVDVFIQEDMIRQFSMCNPCWDRSHYRIAVLREEHGTGGSEFMYDRVRPGDLLEISPPKHMFKLAPLAKQHLLIGGGIGITPIMCMAYALQRDNTPFELHYCVRTEEHMAFASELNAFAESANVHFHLDGGDPSKGLNLAALLKEQESGTHLYYCGPPGMMSAAKEASAHWQQGTVHYELFAKAADADETLDQETNREFKITLTSTGETFVVEEYQTIVDVLRENGYSIDTSCEDGFCGTCLTRYVAGEPEHRDEVLDDEDREEYVMICCARSRTPELVLDL